MSLEKPKAEYSENITKFPSNGDQKESERLPEAMGVESSEIAPGYFYSMRSIGAFCAIGFGFLAATGETVHNFEIRETLMSPGGYALIGPLLGDDINEHWT